MESLAKSLLSLLSDNTNLSFGISTQQPGKYWGPTLNQWKMKWKWLPVIQWATETRVFISIVLVFHFSFSFFNETSFKERYYKKLSAHCQANLILRPIFQFFMSVFRGQKVYNTHLISYLLWYQVVRTLSRFNRFLEIFPTVFKGSMAPNCTQTTKRPHINNSCHETMSDLFHSSICYYI